MLQWVSIDSRFKCCCLQDKSILILMGKSLTEKASGPFVKKSAHLFGIHPVRVILHGACVWESSERWPDFDRADHVGGPLPVW